MLEFYFQSVAVFLISPFRAVFGALFHVFCARVFFWLKLVCILPFDYVDIHL